MPVNETARLCRSTRGRICYNRRPAFPRDRGTLMPPSRPPWWMYLVAVSYFAYLIFLPYTVFTGPDLPPGLEFGFTGGGIQVKAVVPGSFWQTAGLVAGDRVESACTLTAAIIQPSSTPSAPSAANRSKIHGPPRFSHCLPASLLVARHEAVANLA